jgi:hypothetical protein
MILFTTLARLDSSIEKDILIWEMENSKEEDRLFICRIIYAWISSPYRYRGTAYVFQIFSRTTGDIPDLACSPGPSKAYQKRFSETKTGKN